MQTRPWNAYCLLWASFGVCITTNALTLASSTFAAYEVDVRFGLAWLYRTEIWMEIRRGHLRKPRC